MSRVTGGPPPPPRRESLRQRFVKLQTCSMPSTAQMASRRATKRQRTKVDYDHVILGLPSVFPPPPKKKRPRAAGKKGAAQSEKTTTTGERKNRKAAPRDELTEGLATNSLNEEHPIQEYTGTMEQKNPANSKDILEDSIVLSQEQGVVYNEQHIPKEQSGIGPQHNLANAGEDILAGDPAGLLLLANAGEDILAGNPAGNGFVGFAEEPNAVNNEHHILDEQAGTVQQRNTANAQEDIGQEILQAAVMDDIFEFPLKNQLLEDLDYHLKD